VLILPGRLLGSLVLILFGAGPVVAGGDLSADEARVRVTYHLQQADALVRQFEGMVTAECPRFATRTEWDGYVDDTIDRVVLLAAHIEQAWVEAKRTADDEVRREAKAPRKRMDQARLLVEKLQGCADNHGTGLPTASLLRRIEREVPLRQAEIALPQ
jgi:hypothetical protein